MNKYVHELFNERKMLNARRDNLLRAVDLSINKKNYHKVKDRNIEEVIKLRERIKEIDKKIDFILNLDRMMKYEKINESDFNFERDKKESMGKRQP